MIVVETAYSHLPLALQAVDIALSGAIGGAINTGTLRGTLIGAATAEAFWGVGGLKADLGADKSVPTGVVRVVGIAGHAAVGCVSAAAGGGRCASGAVSGGLGEITTAVIAPGLPNNTLLLTAVVGLGGGTGSALTGGRFGDGFGIAAAGYLFNDALQGDSRHYNQNDPNYHSYQFTNGICATAEEGCTSQNVFDSLRAYAAPGQESPAVTGGQVSVPFAGRITQFVDLGSLSVYNITAAGHMFDPGYVQRSVTSADGLISIQTTGEGTGSYRLLNVEVARPAFTALDAMIRMRTVPMAVPTH